MDCGDTNEDGRNISFTGGPNREIQSVGTWFAFHRISLMKMERVSTQIDFPTEFAELCAAVSAFFDASELSCSDLQQEFESAAQEEEVEAEENEEDEEDAVITEISPDKADDQPSTRAEARPTVIEIGTPTKIEANIVAKTGEKSAKKKAESSRDSEMGITASGETKATVHRSASKHENRSVNGRKL